MAGMTLGANPPVGLGQPPSTTAGWSGSSSGQTLSTQLWKWKLQRKLPPAHRLTLLAGAHRVPCLFMYIIFFSFPPFVHIKNYLIGHVVCPDLIWCGEKQVEKPFCVQGSFAHVSHDFINHIVWEAAQSTCIISFTLDKIIDLMFAYKGSSYHVSNTSNSISPTPD